LNRIDEILQNAGLTGLKKNKLALPVEGKIAMIEYDSILYCESDGNYTNIYLSNQKKIMVSRTLKDVESSLPHPPFLRIHHSFVVNINHIKEYIRGEGGEVLLSNGDQIRVSRNKKEELLAALY
jgi:two-component system LytT family response regulator